MREIPLPAPPHKITTDSALDPVSCRAGRLAEISCQQAAHLLTGKAITGQSQIREPAVDFTLAVRFGQPFEHPAEQGNRVGISPGHPLYQFVDYLIHPIAAKRPQLIEHDEKVEGILRLFHPADHVYGFGIEFLTVLMEEVDEDRADQLRFESWNIEPN